MAPISFIIENRSQKSVKENDTAIFEDTVMKMSWNINKQCYFSMEF